MQVKSIAECSKRAFCNTLTFIKLPFAIKTIVLSIFESQFHSGFIVQFNIVLEEMLFGKFQYGLQSSHQRYLNGVFLANSDSPCCPDVSHQFHIWLDIKQIIQIIPIAQYWLPVNSLQSCHDCKLGAQWLSGRMLDWRRRGCGFEPHWHHCIVPLS